MFYFLAVISFFLAAIAQIFLKKSAMNSYRSLWREYFNVWVFAGYLLMGFSLLLNVFALANGVLLKELGAIGSVSYFFVPSLTFIFFGDRFSLRQILSIVLIILGSIVFFIE